MEPFTAALILSTILAGVSSFNAYDNNNSQIENQNKLQAQQEQARQDQVRNEVGAAGQRTQTALTNAANRNSAPAGQQFASVLGGMPSVKSGGSSPVVGGSSGTFN